MVCRIVNRRSWSYSTRPPGQREELLPKGLIRARSIDWADEMRKSLEEADHVMREKGRPSASCGTEPTPCVTAPLRASAPVFVPPPLKSTGGGGVIDSRPTRPKLYIESWPKRTMTQVIYTLLQTDSHFQIRRNDKNKQMNVE